MLRTVIQSLVPGLFTGALIAIFSVTFAALIFSGPLTPFLSQGIAVVLLAGVVAGTGFVLFSRVYPITAIADEDTSPVFALMLALLVAGLPASASGTAMFSTALAAIMVTTALTGLGLLFLGLTGFGRFIQFLPHSVMGGYFSAVGWLLLVGGLQLTGAGADATPGEAGLTRIAQQWPQWLPAVVLAGVLLFLRHRFSQSWLMPVAVLVAIPAWFLAFWLAGVSPGQANAAGYLLGPFEQPARGLAYPLLSIDVSAIDWLGIAGQAQSMASILLIAVLSLMLNISGLGLAYRQDPDMNRELRVAGLSNLASGMAGGMAGLPSYSLSTLSCELGAPRVRWAPLAGLLFSALILIAGLAYVAWLPRGILAGILAYLGLSLLQQWVIEGRRQFAPIEYLVIPIILLTSIFAGFLEGVFVGMVAAIILFVIKYSRTRVVRFTASGAQIMSNVDRAADDEGYLRERGDALFVMGLQGYLFFGTASQVYQALTDRLAAADRDPPAYVVLDFSQVTGLDASAALSFEKMRRLVTDHQAQLVLCGLEPELQLRLESGGFGQEQEETTRFPDLDRALEWVEAQLLAGTAEAAVDLGCFDQMGPYLTQAQLEILRSYLTEREVGAGEVLARQGDASESLFFMETCAGSAYIDTPQGDTHRVRQSARGTIFGELGFYLGIPRTATVKADGPGIIFVLDRSGLERLQQEQPEIAAGFHGYMARLLSERLMFTTRTLRAVLM